MSHFSAVLDQHHPQAVKFSLYESSTANSRREFRTETRESSSGAEMKTLYDLLGALPKDDAEGLRTAFRQAVKGAHPDIRPGDPDAALKFRQIVRARREPLRRIYRGKKGRRVHEPAAICDSGGGVVRIGRSRGLGRRLACWLRFGRH